MPKKKSTITPEEMNIFLEAIKGTKPLKKNKVRLEPPPPTASSVKIAQDEEEQWFGLEEFEETPHVESETFINYKHMSISNKILRNLRKGQYNVEAILDLHGMNIEKAKIEVERFLLNSLKNKKRVVLIIHGKGKHNKIPVLKNKLNHWLRGTNVVLAFCSADSAHGSRGAVYVLLKRFKSE